MNQYPAYRDAKELTGRHYLPEALPARIEYPLEINLIISDLDGTLTPTYMALEAAHLIMKYFGDQLKDKSETVDQATHDAAEYFRRYVPIENLLHEPELALRTAVIRIARDKGHRLLWELSEDRKENFVHNACALAKLSFIPFEGVLEFLELANQAKTVFNLYTHTAPHLAVARLTKANLDPKSIGFIYSRASDRESQWPYSCCPKEQAFLARLRRYRKSKSDGNPEPILKMQEDCNAKPATTLVIGEGVSDFVSVHFGPDYSHRIANFAFQRQGAQMPSVQVDTNERLRPGKHPIGLEGFERQCGITGRTDVIHLPRGFATLAHMVRNNQIVLKPTPVAPVFAEAVRVGRQAQVVAPSHALA